MRSVSGIRPSPVPRVASGAVALLEDLEEAPGPQDDGNEEQSRGQQYREKDRQDRQRKDRSDQDCPQHGRYNPVLDSADFFGAKAKMDFLFSGCSAGALSPS